METKEVSDEFKQEAVRLCKQGDRTIGDVARELDLTESALRLWVNQYDADRGKGPPGALTSEEREELRRLRKEVKRLREEKTISKKPRPSSRRKASEILLHPRGEGQPSGRSEAGEDHYLSVWVKLVRTGSKK